MQAKIEMYTTGSCFYCHRARLLLGMKDAPFTEYRVDLEPDLRDEMEERANGRTSVPQIFINGQHIGGSDELYVLEHDGTLDELLEAD